MEDCCRSELALRVVVDNIPQPAAVKYYSQRAREGTLLLTEATPVLQQGQGYPCVPGIYTSEQVEAWKPIVKGVKDKGAVFWQQLWHVGRNSHQGTPPSPPGSQHPTSNKELGSIEPSYCLCT